MFWFQYFRLPRCDTGLKPCFERVTLWNDHAVYSPSSVSSIQIVFAISISSQIRLKRHFQSAHLVGFGRAGKAQELLFPVLCSSYVWLFVMHSVYTRGVAGSVHRNRNQRTRAAQISRGGGETFSWWEGGGSVGIKNRERTQNCGQ